MIVIFPVENDTAATQVNELGWGITFDFNFNGDGLVLKDGKLVELAGLDALKIWIQKILTTEKNKYAIYIKTDATYGTKAKEYLHSSRRTSLTHVLIQNDIITALTTHDDIYTVNNFEFKNNKRELVITFTVNTSYGQFNEEVTV